MGAIVKIVQRAGRTEPLLWFTVCGGLLLFLQGAVFRPQSDEIVLTRELVQIVTDEGERDLGRPLTEAERTEMLATYIDQEVLFREALNRGLIANDNRVRHRLVEKMRFLIEPEPPEPTDDQLQAFHAQYFERYQTPGFVSFDHVFYQRMPLDPVGVLADLGSGLTPREAPARYWLGPKLLRVSAAELQTVLGKEFTGQVFAITHADWAGPLRSSRGFHYVRLLAREKPGAAALADIADQVRYDWAVAWLAEERRVRLDLLRDNFRIEGIDLEGDL